MYQALYRKYRPQRFADVAGQEHITETLRRQIVNDRLSHAYLFVGTRGTGKTTCAKILSRAVNCQNSADGEPCNKCIACIGIEDGSILDVLELDAASNNSVDNVRALRDEAIYSPATVKKRVYIVDEVHMLSISAFNALLKILEEPPEHILFILATTELHKVPATIQGRCQKFSFKRLPVSVLEERLNLIASKESLALTPEAAEKLASLADGSMRDGISLLDQCAYDSNIDLTRVKSTLGLTGQEELFRLIETITSNDIPSALGTIDELYSDGRDMSSLINETASLVRDLLVFKLSPDSGLLNAGFDKSALSALSNKLSSELLFFYLDILKAALAGLQRGGSSKLAVEICFIKMCAGVQPQVQTTATTPKTQPPAKPPPTLSPPANPKPTPPPPAEPAPATQDDFWTKTLKILKSEPSVHALLSDSNKAQAELQSDILIIKVTDIFTSSLIESDSDLIKNTAKVVLGSDVRLQVEVVDNLNNEKTKQNKLDSLSAFGIVNFE